MIVRRKLKKYSDIWPIDERAGNPPEGWPGWPEGKKFALVLTHDVESEKGLEKVIELAKLEESMGFRSSFNFVAEDYEVPQEIIDYLKTHGFEIGIHGLNHKGNIFKSYRDFKKRVPKINEYLKKWGAVGFRAPSMYHNLNWVGELNIEYDSSTFDTVPFEPQPDAVGTIFPFLVPRHRSFNKINPKDQIDEKNQIDQINQINQTNRFSLCALRSAPGDTKAFSPSASRLPPHDKNISFDAMRSALCSMPESSYFVELPYTLPQDHLLFILLQEKDISIWKKKLDWIAEKGGMALVNIHPDYINFGNINNNWKEYSAVLYRNLLEYVKEKYEGQFLNINPKNITNYLRGNLSFFQKKNINKHKILHLAYTFFEFDTRVKRYPEALAEEGYEIDVISLKEGKVKEEKGSDEEKLSNIRLFKIQKRSINEKNRKDYFKRLFIFFIKSMFIITKKHFKNKYALIHVHNIPDFLVFATFIPKLLGSKIIFDIHDILPEFYINKFNGNEKSITFKALKTIEKLACKYSDFVIISNHLWAQKIISRSVNKNKICTLINYPDEKIFYPREKYRKNKKFILIYPGTLNWHQGVDITIRAISLVIKEVPDLEFHIYGDGPEKANLSRLIDELKLRNNVLLKEIMALNEIAKKMAEADIGIVPKRNDSFGGEAFSTKILEFMALGTPVIVSKTRIDQYYFNDSVVKFFEPENEEDLAKAILELVKNQELRQNLSKNALNFVQDYLWSKHKHEYLNLVNYLIRGN
ncbi:MAG: glycosyltransferase [bacterium]